MDKVITYNFSEDCIARLAEYLELNFLKKDTDLSKIAVVFGGKRPALFLKRELARRIKKSFIPPKSFSIDNLIHYLVSKRGAFRMAPELDACYIIYNAARNKAPGILHGREEFSQFLPWAREVADFIDELDLEGIENTNLKAIEASAAIGYEVPESINRLLQHIVVIRELFHAGLKERKLYSRGLLYMDCSKIIGEASLQEFDQLLFCNFYYLHKTEEEIIRNLYERNKAILFFQKDERDWPVFKDLARKLHCRIEPQEKTAAIAEPKIYKGFDSHSQVGLVREILGQEILKDKKDLAKTLILLSEPNNLIPLLSEIAWFVEDFNVSMGYPLKRSSLYSLFQYIFKAQSRRKNDLYYTKDYLQVLLHPLIKNLLMVKNPAITRILCHKIEEVLLGMSKTALSGSLFVSLDAIEASGDSYLSAALSLVKAEPGVTLAELKAVISGLHEFAFRIWENIDNFSKFVSCLERFTNLLLEKSVLGSHPLNTKIIEKICDIEDELKNAEFRDQPFRKEDIYKIFESKLQAELVAFSGSPLKGLQILGLLETRSLTFENVIIMDANESVLPKMRVYEPLIPRQIMEGLGLERLKQEEEIQRYHFMRLISGAKRIFLVYDDNPEKEKSRFIEEIIWKKQQEKQSLNVLEQSHAKFNINSMVPERIKIEKNNKITGYLAREFIYSASSIDTYLNCPLQFYYQYVLRLKEKEDLLDAPEAADIGNFIHAFFDHVFREFLGKKPVIDQQFEERFFLEFDRRFEEELSKRMGSEAFMVKDIMEYRLQRFLKHERQRQVKQILELEQERTDTAMLLGKSCKFKYRIDRIDMLEDGSLLIIDYKTGGNPSSVSGLTVLEKMTFERQSIKRVLHSFQLPLYYYFVKQRYGSLRINAALYSVRKIEFTEFIRAKDIDNADKIIAICLKALEAILREITDKQAAFYADNSDERTCEYCQFSSLCR